MIVVVIIGILAAIAIPIFANQQKSALVAGIKSDVKNTNSNIVAALVKSPTAPDIKTLNAALVKSDPDTVITVGGTWDNYYIHATNKNIGTASTPQPAAGESTTIPAKTRSIPITNPDFESGISGWDLYRGPGTLSHETANPISGTGSLKVSGADSTLITYNINQSTKTLIKAGETVSVSIKYKTAGNGYLGIGIPGTAGSSVFDSSATSHTITFKSPEDGDTFYIYWTATGNGSPFYADDIIGTITTPATTSTGPSGTSYNQSGTGFGVVYSSSLGKIVTQND